MDGMKNYYKTLNIADLEQALISAGYSKSKSELLKRKSDFESMDAFNAKMSEIEEAYQVLSNKNAKMAHDLALLQAQMGAHVQMPSLPHEESAITYTSAPSTLERDWELASEHFPLITQEYDRLFKFDVQLAKTYQTQLHARGSYKDSSVLKNKLEGFFLWYLWQQHSCQGLCQETAPEQLARG